MGFFLIIANIIFSYNGFTNAAFFESYKFEVDRVLINKDYKRLFTSGFLHIGWMHLVFNMITLYAFYGLVENHLGSLDFSIIFFASLVGGNLFSLYVHRNHGDYSAVGASGAVCGIIFASIALFPGIEIGFFGMPFSIPSWLYGILFVLYSIYGVKSQKDNIGHEAHLGGALIGMIAAILIRPSSFSENYTTIFTILLPTIAFICVIVMKPGLFLIDNFYFKNHNQNYSIDHQYNAERANVAKELDILLDKIGKHGMESLTPKEKLKLKQYSKSVR